MCNHVHKKEFQEDTSRYGWKIFKKNHSGRLTSWLDGNPYISFEDEITFEERLFRHSSFDIVDGFCYFPSNFIPKQIADEQENVVCRKIELHGSLGTFIEDSFDTYPVRIGICLGFTPFLEEGESI